MTATPPAAPGEAGIRALIESRVPAVASKSIAALTGHDADDLVLFDAVGPLRSIGAGPHAQRVTEWLAAYQRPIDYQIRDLDVTAGEHVAFCHYLYRVGGMMTDGTQVGMWLRATVCLRRADGDWTIAHEHTSVPFDGRTGEAALAAQP